MYSRKQYCMAFNEKQHYQLLLLVERGYRKVSRKSKFKICASFSPDFIELIHNFLLSCGQKTTHYRVDKHWFDVWDAILAFGSTYNLPTRLNKKCPSNLLTQTHTHTQLTGLTLRTSHIIDSHLQQKLLKSHRNRL